MPYPWISMTTDYGLVDPYVGICHGVIAGIAPDVKIIDITHGVPRQRIRQGAQTLARAVRYLPESVHLAVVDPGVGTDRRGVVVVTTTGLLVGPDNGLLAPAAEVLGGVVAAYELSAASYRLARVSATFHGRDIFAPAAAHLAAGVAPAEFGPQVFELVTLAAPKVTIGAGELATEVLRIDHYGNLVLAATRQDVRAADIGSQAIVRCPNSALSVRWANTFAGVSPGAGLLYVDSAGQLAIAINGGSAAEALQLNNEQENMVTITTTK
jgi:S-adenosylmethionine hydrolase